MNTNNKVANLLSTTTTETTLPNKITSNDKKLFDDDKMDLVLSLQPLSQEELKNYIKKKVLKLNLKFNKKNFFYKQFNNKLNLYLENTN